MQIQAKQETINAMNDSTYWTEGNRKSADELSNLLKLVMMSFKISAKSRNRNIGETQKFETNVATHIS
jgi:hypothetical protein